MDRLRIIRWMTFCFCAVAISLRGSAEPARADEDAAGKGDMPFYAYCMEDGVPGMQPRPVAQQAAILAALGYDGAGYVLWLDDQLRRSCPLRRAGLKLYMAYTFLDLRKPGQPYDRRVPEAIARLKGQPATVCVLLSGRKPGDPQAMEPAVKALRELADAAAKAGVRISIYNHVGDWTERVSFALEVVKKVDRANVGVNFNLCHWLMVEGRRDYRPLIRGNASKIFNVTICGAQVGSKTWRHGLIQPLDCGDFDNRQLLATLREAGYQGPVGLMCESIPDDLQEHLARSMKLWRIWQADTPSGLKDYFKEVEVSTDVVYGHKFALAMTMDVLRPKKASGAGIVWIISGAWHSGDFLPKPLSRRHTRMPASSTAARCWTRGSRFSSFAMATDRDFFCPRSSTTCAAASASFASMPRSSASIRTVSGHRRKAGGHLALMLATTADEGVPNPANWDGVLRTSDRIASAVAYFPPTDIRSWFTNGKWKEYEAFRFDPKLAGDYSPLLWATPQSFRPDDP